MQPTENKQNSQEELIAHIRKTLKTHEESYNLGAWENFNSRPKDNKTPIFWITRLGSVAAIIAVCISLFLFNKTNTKQSKNDVVKINSTQTKDQLANEISNDPTEIVAIEHTNRIAHNISKDLNKSILKESTLMHDNLNNPTPLNDGGNNAVVSAILSVESSQNEKIVDQKIAALTDEKEKTNDFLSKETHKIESAPGKIVKNKDKWVLGLMVAPSFGNKEELNLGYGISVGYNISNKLSLITGVSYNEMSASKDFTGSMGMASILYGNNKSLAAVSQKVTGLDIPLELKYSFNSNVYASIGLSAFAVIGQSRSNTFIQGVVVKGAGNNIASSAGISAGSSVTSDISDSKGQFANTYILNKKIVEKANLVDQNNDNFLGFYNFSIGYKRKMLKNHYVAFEPFVKLPITAATPDNLRLVGAGLRLKIDF